MKRVGFLYERIAEPDNLRLAFVKAARGKQGRGEVADFRAGIEANIRELSRQLQNEQLELGDYRFFQVRDPKKRLICAASFPERVLHHAIMNVCEPVFDRYAIADSYACRPGKGLRRAVERCRFFAGREPWFLKLDIHKYFDSIDHAIVLDLLERQFKDVKLLGLFSKLLHTYHTIPGKGVPIGNLISQHLANFYLGRLKHWLKEERRIHGYLRYMDDFVLTATSKEILRDELTVIRQFLGDHLGLSLKDNIQLNRCGRGIGFLGFRVLPGKVLLAPRSKSRFREKFCRYEKLYLQGLWSEEELAAHVTPLIEFTRNADSLAYRKNVMLRHGVSL